MSKQKVIYIKTSQPGKFLMVDDSTGEVLGYAYKDSSFLRESLSKDLDSIFLDGNGCINGDYVEGYDPEHASFTDMFFDDRYDWD